MIEAKNVDFYYGDFHALKNISMTMESNTVTAFIGPSGCGKSTFLRLFNRMNDLIPGTRLTGECLVDGNDIYGKGVNVDELRKNVGMVFQKPNPFPKSIFENVAYGLRVNGVRDKAFIRQRVEESLAGAALWDEVKDKLKKSAYELSGGQQQRRFALDTPHGRTRLGARPHLHLQNRGTHPFAQKGVHHRHRHPQHAAGGTGKRQDGLFHAGRAGRIQRHQEDVPQSGQGTDTELYHRPVRLTGQSATTRTMKHTEKELTLLREEVSQMWGLVLSQLEKARQAYLNNDAELAREVASREKRVDTYELKIDSDCENYIALFGPVAVDLRLVLSLIKISGTLERIADFADGIARHVIEEECAALPDSFKEELRVGTMFDTVISMLSDSFVALESENTKLSGRILAKDETVDEIYHDDIRLLAEYMQKEPVQARCVLDTLLVLRKIERIGDHCSNIVEEIVFYIDAKILKHNRNKE